MSPDDEIDFLLLQQRDLYLASVHQTGTDRPVCEEPKTPFPHDECGWDFIDGHEWQAAQQHPLLRRKKLRKMLSSTRLVSGRLWTNLTTRSCMALAGWTSTRETKTNHTAAVNWWCRSTSAEQSGHFCNAASPLEALRSLICATIEELPNGVGQPVASTETGVLMLIDVRLAHFYIVARSRDSQQKPAQTKR